jgi:RNA polymerase sigma factor (sigma-70 family)
VTEDALVRQWAGFATVISREFFHPRIDPDDLRQEALIAVMEAVRVFDPSRGVTFKTFVARCIRNRIVETIIRANRMKRDVRMELPREAVAADGDALPTVELIPALNADPHELLEIRDEVRRIVRGFRALTPLEQRAITEVLDGVTQDKSTDNAAYRARNKLRDVDHLCKTRNCMNPKHMEAVTSAENVARGAVCRCGTCARCLRNSYMRDWYARRKVA